MNFKEFMLIEHKYSDKIELDEVINLLTKFFKNSKNIPTTFYRGMSNIGDYAKDIFDTIGDPDLYI